MAVKKYYHDIDLDNNQLISAVIENRASAPSSPVDGQVYFNTTDKKVYYYNSATTSWKAILIEVAGFSVPSDTSQANWNTAYGWGNHASAGYQVTSQKGAANGYASLDSGGKVPASQLPSSLMEYKGVWNASTNTPTLVNGTGDTGDVYRVSVAGTQNLGSGNITFDIGDYVIYNGSTWEKSDTTDAVASVNGQTGVVSLTTANISEVTNLYYTDARARAAISLTTTGTSGAATYNSTTGVLNIPQYSAGAAGVSSITFGTTGLTPNTATTGAVTVAGTLVAANGGTGQSTYTIGDILYASATTTLAKLAAVAAGSYLRSAGTGTAPVWSTVTIPNAATLGDIWYGSAANVVTALTGNITATKQYLSQTGTGTVSAAPAWSTIAGSDVTGAALTKTDDTNVTLTLGGTPTTALLRAASLTLGWTGTLAVSRGGTGASTLTGVVIGNAASAMTAVSSTTALQVLRVNAGGTGYEFATLSTGGSVTTVSVVSANGLAGTVATATTTPAITLSTTITGILKGNGTAISAAVAGTDYLTTAVTSITFGSTGLTPNTATSGAVTVAGTLVAANGGTGQSSYAIGDLLYASTTTALSKLAAVAAGSYLRSAGTGTAPVWSTVTIPNAATLGDIWYGSAASTVSALAGNTTTTKQYLSQTGNGTVSAAPSWSAIAGADVTGSALTKTDDTNVTLTLGGTPATALLRAASITVGWTGSLATGRGGTGLTTYTLGDIIYASAANTLSALAGNITTTRKFLRQTGNATISAAPVWDTILAADVPGSALTKTDDTNVTLTLGGSATTALLNAASLTLGWTGTLAVGRGGTGASTLTGVLIGNGTSAVTAVTGTASQLLRRNAGDTAYEFFTPTYLTANQSITLSGDVSGTGTTAITTTIGANKVTNAMLAQVATGSFLGRVTAATGNVETLTGTQATTLLDTFTSTLKGLVPSPAGATTTFLRADGTWAAPSGSGTVTTLSVVSANGFAGTVANATSTPAITLSTTVTGVLKGNGTAISAAVANTDYLAVADPAYTGAITTGTLTFTPANHFAALVTSSALYNQLITQNSSNGAAASNDIVVNNNISTDSANYGDFGINSSNYTGSGSFSLGNATYLYAHSGDLSIGTYTSNAIHFVINNGTADAATIKTTGQLQLPGYTTTTSFSGTAVGFLAFDSSGNVITTASPTGGYTVTSQTSNYTETATSGTKIIKCSTAGGSFTVTLPTAVGNTATLIIKKTAGSANLIVDGAGTETIDGGLTATIVKVEESITLVSDNTNWLIV